MVAPIDAKASFDVEGETITLRLNFRTIALAEHEGMDILGGADLPPLKVAMLLRCLAVQDHPEMQDDEAFAIVIKGGSAVGEAVASLMEQFGKASSTAGNAKPKATAKKVVA